MPSSGKSQITLDWPNHCTPERLGALLVNPGVSGSVGHTVGSVPTKGCLKYSRSKLTPAWPLESVVPKLLRLAAVGETSFLLLKPGSSGSLMYVCLSLLRSLRIRNHMTLLCILSCSNNPDSITMCTAQNHSVHF